jgi:hypothetical protein
LLVGFFEPDVSCETLISATLVQENEARSRSRQNWVTGTNYGLNVRSVQENETRKAHGEFRIYLLPPLQIRLSLNERIVGEGSLIGARSLSRAISRFPITPADRAEGEIF